MSIAGTVRTPPRLSFSLALDPARLLRARQRIRDYLHEQLVLPMAVDSVVIAVEEAMTNAVRHSGSSEELEVELYFDGADLVAEIRDHGIGFDVEAFDRDRVPDPLALGGRGLFLMAKLMDELELRHDGGIEVRGVKRGVLHLDSEDRLRATRPTVTMPGDEGYWDERHRALLDEIGERVASLDWQYRYLFANKTMLRAMGLSAPQVLGKSVWDLLPEAVGSPWERALRDAMELGRSSVLEHESAVTNEWTESRFYPTANGISVFSRDISERKRKELERDELIEALRESEERFATMFEKSPFALALTRMPERTTVAVNPTMERVLGFDRDEFVGHTSMDLGIADKTTHDEIAARLEAEGAVRQFECRRTTRDGESRWVSLNVDPITIGGKPHVLTTLYDITERKRAEEERERLIDELSESDERASFLADVVEKHSVPFGVGAPDGRLLLFNQAFAELTGYSREELEAKELTWATDLTPPEWREAEAEALAQAVRDRRAARYEKEYLRKDGTRVPIELFVQPVFDDAGEVVQYRSFMSDITERKLAEEKSEGQQHRVEVDLDAMRRLQALGTRFVREGTLEALLDEIVETGMAIAGSDCGNCQVLDSASGRLRIAAHRNLPRWWLDYWQTVEEGRGTCGTAMRRAERVIVEDVATSPVFVGTPDLDVQLKAGIRAVISTPLFSRSGDLLGMISQHFTRPHRPDRHTLGLLDLLARQAVEIIERSQIERALRDSEERLRFHLENTPLAVVEWDQDFVVTRWAGEAEAMFGWSAAETVGRPIMDLDMIYADDIPIVERTMERLTDGRHSQVVSSNRNVTKDGRVIECTWYNSVLLDTEGRMSSVMSVVEDYTERKHAHEALREQARLGEVLTTIDALVHSSLETSRAVEAALSEGACALGATSAVVTSHQPGAFRIDHLFGESTEQIGRLIPDELDTPGLLALTRGETVVIEDAQTDPRMSRVLADEFDVRSLLVAPLVREGETFGCLYFVFRERPHVFTPGEIDFAHRLATSLSLALENAALYEAQRDIAVTLQGAFMHSPPKLEGLELGVVGLTASQPALVGGDFWDLFALPDDKVLVVIGDVAGKGIPAAALTETVHSTMRAFATVDDSPGFILRKTNDLLVADEGLDQFVTALVLVLDVRKGRARIASAGHPGPIRLSEGSCVTIDPEYRVPLGAFAAEYPTTDAQLGRGDYFVLYTDGITEARSGGKLFGEEQARATLSALWGQSAQDVAADLAGAASSFAGALRDDLQVLVVRRT